MFMEQGNCITYSLVVPTSLVEGLSFEQAYAYLDDWVMGALAEIGVNARYVPLNDIASEHPDWAEYRAAMQRQGKALLRVTVERWGPVATGGFPPELASS